MWGYYFGLGKHASGYRILAVQGSDNQTRIYIIQIYRYDIDLFKTGLVVPGYFADVVLDMFFPKFGINIALGI